MSVTKTTAVRVLIVEDEPADAEFAKRTLSAGGRADFDTCLVEQVSEALDCFQHGEFDALLLDLGLPGYCGLEALQEIRSEDGEIPIVVLTGLSDERVALQAIEQGAQDYLVKGQLTADSLTRSIRYAILRQQLLAALREQTAIVRRAHEETINRLVTASMYRDEETGAHIRRVGMYSALMAEALGWSWDDVDRIRMAAPMHDIGKIGIPDAVLQKLGKLTPEEYEVMKRHTLIGAEMLVGSESPVLELGRIIALNHHERWDGQGYPTGLSTDDIPECARIVAIVDVYDALTHDRVYRPALPEEEAIRILENGQGTHFDPSLLRVFLSLLPEIKRIERETPDDSPADALREKLPRLALDVQASEAMLQGA